MPDSTFTYNGQELSFSTTRDIGINELRHIKNWYGSELGSYTGLTNLSAHGDPDALACVIWIAMRKAGLKPREPMNMPDFAVGEFMGSFVTDGNRVYTTVPPIRMAIDGTEYTLDITHDLTLNRLRQIKRWYPEFGSLVTFSLGLFRGDPDALACSAWVVRTVSGEVGVPEPRLMDFSAGEVIDSYDIDEPEEAEIPEPPGLWKKPDEKESVVMADPPLPTDGAKSSEPTQMSFGGDTAPPLPSPSE